MARPKDVNNRKKRMKTIILNKIAFITLRSQIEQFGSFDFSAWVSKKVIEEFGRGPEAQLMAQIEQLVEEHKILDEEYRAKIGAQTGVLSDLRNKMRANGEKTMSVWDY